MLEQAARALEEGYAMKNFASTSLLCCLVSTACNGTETQNPVNGQTGPLVSFGNSGCKKEVLSQAAVRTDAIITDAGIISYGQDVAGLKCVAWQMVAADEIKISLINFEDACGAQWQGGAEFDGPGALHLSLVNPQCMIAACGWCIYDWSFDVKNATLQQNLPVIITVDTCPGQQGIKTSNVELPIGVEPSGIKCQYANFNALGWQAMSLGTCGTMGMPCTGTSMCSSGGVDAGSACQGNLTCTDNGDAAQQICAGPCAADSDCGTTGALSCQAGLCRPKTPW